MNGTVTLAPVHPTRNKSPWAGVRQLHRPSGTIGSATVKAGDKNSDEQLVARIVSGDQRAFAEIVRRHAGRLKALALGFCGMPGEADDVVQEAFWSFWRHAGRWRADGPPLSAYLARIAVNRAIDMNRRRKVRAFFGLDDAAEVIDSQVPPDHRVIASSELAAVARDLLTLPPRQREALLLSADGVTTNAEIAVAMGLTVGAVEQLLVRARRTLRVQLAARENLKGDVT